MSQHSQPSGDMLSERIDEAIRRAAELSDEPSEARAAPRHGGLRIDYSAIDSLNADIRAAVSHLDQPPPTPPTWRGRVGRFLIGLLRRGLWWQTHQFKPVFEAFVRRSAEERWVLERIGAAVEELDRRQGRLEAAHVASRSETLDWARLDDLRETQTRLGRLEHTVGELSAALADLSVRRSSAVPAPPASAVSPTNGAGQDADKAAERLRDLTDATGKLETGIEELGRYEHRTRAQLALLERRVATVLKAVRAGAPQPESDAMSTASREPSFDYWLFESAFRGTRDEIKERQRVYLDLFEGDGKAPREPVLDLGCGRGEWLELLGETGISASGVDVNEEMLEECRSRSLCVESRDALDRLRETPSSSLGMVTAFHLVEHLPIETLVELIDETARTLKPGGLCLFETPNPANILVATQGFYLDPTHQRPLPSPLLRYLVEARGLCDVRCREVNPYPDWVGEQEGDSLEARFNRLVYGPRDYAVIAAKP